MRVYLCGPMRGYPAWNAAAFDRYAAEWEEEGHTVLSPVARDRLGKDWTRWLHQRRS
jgi:hypothetical protein